MYVSGYISTVGVDCSNTVAQWRHMASRIFILIVACSDFSPVLFQATSWTSEDSSLMRPPEDILRKNILKTKKIVLKKMHIKYHPLMAES